MVATLTPAVDVPCLSDGAESPDDLVGDFYAAHVKSRQEKAFARDLSLRGIGYYLPMCERVTQTSQRRRYIVEQPIFPGYVFFAGSEHAPAEAMSTGRVCKTIAIPNQSRIRRELKNLFDLWRINPRLEPVPELVKGVAARVTSGVFEGIEGVVVERKRGAVLVIQVSGFGQAAIEIPADLVERAD